MQKRKIDLVFKVLQIIVTSTLFWSIVTHLRVKCSPPKDPDHWISLAAASRSPLSHGHLNSVHLYVILSNDGSSGKCWTLKYHQNHQVPAACCICFVILVRQQGVCNLSVCVYVESRWLRHRHFTVLLGNVLRNHQMSEECCVLGKSC